MTDLLILVVLLLLPLHSEGLLSTYNYTQKLDHSDPHSITFQQNVMLNDNQWAGAKSGAPIFVLVGGVKDGPETIDDYGLLKLCAIKFQALLVYIEHRFHGESIPLGSIESAMSDYRVRKFLTTEQALKDSVTIIQSLKVNLSAHNSPIIVVGIGYGGALAVWLRLRYPEIAIGALASSTQLLYYGKNTPGNGYCTTVSNDFKAVDPICYETIRRSWKAIDNYKVYLNGLARLSQIFNTCRPLQSTWEVKKWLAQLFSEAAQSEDPTNMAITFICSQISTTKNLIKALAATLHNELNDGRKCSDYILVQVDSPFEPDSNYTTASAWLRCNELIFPVGCEHDTMLPAKPFHMAQFTRSCHKRFGEVLQPSSHINFYGNYDIEGFIRDHCRDNNH
ncbi:uncharacterized protein [Spinacia oleracea]|uniref:Uncharacterized protein isoform X3 n=1 Tax=Spinacia oleracea TaxID=3562 RepID=A0A9R0I920_SPIOL|nr:uncharacterized protein LOC110784728 isoform X3 [Spinacia oleracea]